MKLKGFQICAYFFASFSGCGVISILVIFHLLKVAKDIWDQCCYLAAECGSPSLHSSLGL
jgi:hypothetical protein